MSSRYPGAAAALSAAAVACALLAGCGDTDGSLAEGSDPTPSVTSSTPPAPDVQIPEDFPLTEGLPRTNGDDGSPVTVTETGGIADIELCGDVAWSPGGPRAAADVAGTSYTGEAEDSRARTLALYADERSASAALAHARDAFAACPAGEVGGTEQVYEEIEGDADSATLTHRYRTDGRFDTGLEVLQLVRSGSALYLASYYGEGGGSPESIASFVTFARDSSAPVVDALADLAGSDAGTPEDAPEVTAADVPLGAGWPQRNEPGSRGAEVPVDSFLADFSTYACDGPAPTPGSSEVLRGQYSDVEDYRTRELVVLDDAQAAVAWVGQLRAFYEACPVVREDGLSYPLTVLDTAVGGQSFGVVRSTEFEGEPAIGLSTLHVVRVGRSVLLDSASGEGWAPNPEADGRRVLDAMAADAAVVVEAQCAFTEAGC